MEFLRIEFQDHATYLPHVHYLLWTGDGQSATEPIENHHSNQPVDLASSSSEPSSHELIPKISLQQTQLSHEIRDPILTTEHRTHAKNPARLQNMSGTNNNINKNGATQNCFGKYN